jgi:fructose-bisphosphate aldolase class II
MPLVPVLPGLEKAQQEGYALPCFDTIEMLGTQGIYEALEEAKAPGLIGIWSGMLDRSYAKATVTAIRAMADEVTVPVSIILDHGQDYEHCIKALAWGFTDVMYDGSSLPIEENIATTRLIVRAAHAVGAAVEAELGHVGRGSEYQEFGARREGFTDPDDVERFVAETGVDFLAVAIGTAHGMYEGEPQLDLDLLAEIRQRVDIPLVLHGGSGLAEEQFRAAIEIGISKVNIFTNLARAATAHLLEAAQDDRPSYFSMIRSVTEAFRESCLHHLELFGTSGKAL